MKNCKYCKFLVQVPDKDGNLVDTCCFHNEVKLEGTIDCDLYTEDTKLIEAELKAATPKKKRTKKCS